MTDGARVVGIDAGTVSLDLCILEGGRPAASHSLPTGEALAHPEHLLDLIAGAGSVVLAAGYGMPFRPLHALTRDDLTLALLPDGQGGGIGGLRRLLEALGRAPVPAWSLPGVIHLPTVPAHRKCNRIDMGTADKVATAALLLATAGLDVTAILLELGGAFTAALALEQGQIIDGIGGSMGSLGAQASGALDGELAVLAGRVTKAMIFNGGAQTMRARGASDELAHRALVEGGARMVRQLQVSLPGAHTVYLTGRTAGDAAVATDLAALLPDLRLRPLPTLDGASKAGAQGAAILAGAIAGGPHGAIIQRLALDRASGTVLDHLYVIDPATARLGLGLAP